MSRWQAPLSSSHLLIHPRHHARLLQLPPLFSLSPFFSERVCPFLLKFDDTRVLGLFFLKEIKKSYFRIAFSSINTIIILKRFILRRRNKNGWEIFLRLINFTWCKGTFARELNRAGRNRECVGRRIENPMRPRTFSSVSRWPKSNEAKSMAAFNREISLAHNLRRRSYSRLGFHIKAFSCKLRYVLSSVEYRGLWEREDRAPWWINTIDIYIYIYDICHDISREISFGRKLIKIFSVSGIEMTLSVGQTGMFYN